MLRQVAGFAPGRESFTGMRVSGSSRNEMESPARSGFISTGFEGASLRRVASEAGVTHAVGWHHFRTKEALWRAAVLDAIAAVESELTARLAAHENDAELDRRTDHLLEIGTAVVSAFRTEPDVLLLLLREGAGGSQRCEPIYEYLLRLRDAVSSAVHRAKRRGLSVKVPIGDFFLLLLTAGVIPCALPELTKRATRRDLSADRAATRHARRVLSMLLG